MRRRWRDKFTDAGRGLFAGIATEANFRIHVSAAGLALLGAAILRCDALEWALILFGIGLVFTAELMNTAIERMFHGLDEGTRGRIHGCLDIAAGAVLAASGTAAGIGLVIFLPKLVR